MEDAIVTEASVPQQQAIATVEAPAKRRGRPRVKPTEMQKLEEQFDRYDNQIKELTDKREFNAPPEPVKDPREIALEAAKKEGLYLKPIKTVGPGVNPKTLEREKFNEKFRAEYEYRKQYVNFTCVNNEIIGEALEPWTKPFPGMNAEQWRVPCNKPVWGPRYLAEQIKRKYYHRLKTEEHTITSGDGMGKYYGNMIVDHKVQRLDAHPIHSEKRSDF